MPGFDPTLDKELFGKAVEVGSFRLKVAVMSYNDGMAKVHIGRERINKEGQATFAKLGRMTLEEAKAIAPLLNECIKFMEEQALNPDNAN